MYAELRSLSGSPEAIIRNSQLLITYIPQDLIDGTQLFWDRTNVCRCSGATKNTPKHGPWSQSAKTGALEMVSFRSCWEVWGPGGCLRLNNDNELRPVNHFAKLSVSEVVRHREGR